jgi:Ca2+-binding EF-hand superfamily protein
MLARASATAKPRSFSRKIPPAQRRAFTAQKAWCGDIRRCRRGLCKSLKAANPFKPATEFSKEMPVFNPIWILAATAVAVPSAQMAQAQIAQPTQAPRQVTKADFTKNLDARFATLDTNKDGVLTKDEISAAQTRALQQAAEAQQQRLQAEFQKLDTNKDNQLSLAEFRAAAQPVRPQQTPDQMIAQLDTNKDGRISAQEYRAPQMTNFDRADANKDGVLTPQEVQAARNNR